MVRPPRCAQSSGTDTLAHSSCVPQPVQLIAGSGAERSDASAAAVTGARAATAVPAARTETARARPRWNRAGRDGTVLFGAELSMVRAPLGGGVPGKFKCPACGVLGAPDLSPSADRVRMQGGCKQCGDPVEIARG